jgi:CRP/FNR family transcriptional regulator, cyclic AMP receptor protein
MTISKTSLPYLDNNTLFAVLTPADRAIISQESQVISYSKQQLIYEPGDSTAKTFILVKGAAKITIHAEKKDIIKYMVRPGALFGESFLTGELRRRDFAYAMEDYTEVVALDAQLMITMMRRNFAFAQSLLYFLGDRLRNTEMQLEKVVLKDSKSRILEYLHQMGIEQGKAVGMEILVRHNMTHQDIADLTGTSRQMVTAVLNQLKRENVLYFNRKKILFRDLNALPAAS